jgi:flagellar biosynthesis protein FlhF
MMQRTKVVAEDSREAMARITREFGQDAVILSTRRVPAGVEIIAGHRPLSSGSLGVGEPANQSTPPEPEEAPKPAPKLSQAAALMQAARLAQAGRTGLDEAAGFQREAAKPASASHAFRSAQTTPARPGEAQAMNRSPEEQKRIDHFAKLLSESTRGYAVKPKAVIPDSQPKAMAAAASPRVGEADLSRLSELERSINDIKSMLSSELMINGLKSAGASPALISVFLAQSGALDGENADQRFASFFANRIRHKAPPSLVDGPRVIVTLGPSGCGKTTLLAQLAARFRMARPDERITFVNADTSRLGASDTLRAHGRILDVPVIEVEQAAELASLAHSAGRRLSMFVDMPSNQEECSALLAVLEQKAEELAPLIRCGVVASNLSTESVDNLLTRYPNLDALALTKIDETRVTLSTLSQLSLRGPGVAWLATNPHLVRGLHEPDQAMLEGLIRGSLPGEGSATLNS